jgi:hypothetical protein
MSGRTGRDNRPARLPATPIALPSVIDDPPMGKGSYLGTSTIDQLEQPWKATKLAYTAATPPIPSTT